MMKTARAPLMAALPQPLTIAALVACAAFACSGTTDDGGAAGHSGSAMSPAGTGGGSAGTGGGGGSGAQSGGNGGSGGATGGGQSSGDGGSGGSAGGSGGNSGASSSGSGGSSSSAMDAGNTGAGGSEGSGGSRNTMRDGGSRDSGGSSAGASGSGGSDVGEGGGGSQVSDCAAMPVSPNASAATKKVLCYLYSQYGNHILSGQEDGGGESEINYISSTTGKYPAIRAFDILSAGSNRCISYWKAGGLCMFGYHMGAPGQPDTYEGSKTKVSINNVLTEGSSENTVFKQRMDKVAGVLSQIQDAGGVVIYRPFHEAGGTWFWWSMETGAQYVRLWKYQFDYMTKTKGLKNLLWLLPYDGSPQSSFYPGKDYVDIGGADNYNADHNYDPMNSLFNKTKGVFGATMPIALHECGPIPDPTQLQSTKTNWLMFAVWTDPYPKQSTTADQLKKVYSSDYVVTRDKLPKFQ